jgi:Predicted periplasmic lipoprotein (DUF2279)
MMPQQLPSQIFAIFFIACIFININELRSEKIKNQDTTQRMSSNDFKIANSPRTRIISDLPPLKTKNPWLRTSIVAASMGGVITGQHMVQTNTIWKNKSSFKFQEDGGYALWEDKAGHIYASYFSSYLFTESLLAADFSYEDAIWGGAAMGFTYMTYIEIMDGFGDDFGFSPSDFYFNVIGSAFYLGQYYFPYLQNITPKFVYIPAPWHGELERKDAIFAIDDYSSQTNWLSFNIYNMIPAVQDYWPRWLEISVGYATRNLSDEPAPSGYSNREYKGIVDYPLYGSPRIILALDYNLKQLFGKTDYNFLNWFLQTLDYVKLPSPAVEFEINGKTRFYLMYPFPIN